MSERAAYVRRLLKVAAHTTRRPGTVGDESKCVGTAIGSPGLWSYQRIMTEESTPLLAVRIRDASRMIGIGRTKLSELINAGNWETVKIGRPTLITMQSLHRLIQRLDSPPKAEARGSNPLGCYIFSLT